MFNDTYTVSHRSLTSFVALVVESHDSSVAVQNPSHLYSRRDGKVTIRARDRRNTLTISVHRSNVYGIRSDGTREVISTAGPRILPVVTESGLIAPWERELLGMAFPADFDNPVRAAAEALDNIKPGWESLVDTDSLRMYDGRACICGQVFREEAADTGLYNGYIYAVRTLGNFVDSHRSAFSDDAHQDDWVTLINHRRGL